jgi:hypothetical protein
MKKLLTLGLLLFPSICFADRLGSLKSTAEVLLSSQTLSAMTITTTTFTDGTTQYTGGFYDAVTTTQTDTSGVTTDVSHMAFPVAANTHWSFEFFILNGSTGTSGTFFALSFPAGAVLRSIAIGEAGTSTSIRLDRIWVSNVLTAAFNPQVNSIGWTEIKGSIQNGATPGVVQLRFATKTSPDLSQIWEGSHVNARRIK